MKKFLMVKAMSSAMLMTAVVTIAGAGHKFV